MIMEGTPLQEIFAYISMFDRNSENSAGALESVIEGI